MCNELFFKITMSTNRNDPFGKACLSYLNGNKNLEIEVLCNITDSDVIPVDYLFRIFSEMPEVEQKALLQCKGKALVIGAGAGCHSLWLQEKGFEVDSIDTSVGAIETMKQFGIKNVKKQDFYLFKSSKKYDTIISLMNGVGIAGDLKGLPLFLEKCKSLLKENGQLLIDSTDINYLIEGEEISYAPSENYIGELEYKMIFENEETDWFKWLYIDEEKLIEIANLVDLKTEIITNGGDYNYLAKLTKR